MELELTRDPHAFADDDEDEDDDGGFVGDLADDAGPNAAHGGDPQPPTGRVRRARGSRTGWVTLALTTALLGGVVLGATGRDPVSVPGPTVTLTVTPTPERVETRFGVATREARAALPVIESGAQTVGQGAVPGTWVGIPFAEGEICHWQRIRTDEDGRSVIVAEILTNGPTTVTIRREDARFVSYGCRWTPQG